MRLGTTLCLELEIAMPKVTAVIPCFNHGRFIDQSVDSILNQTFQDFEILVVNDGSTDPFTVDKLHNLNKPKTKVLHKANGHLSSARNAGIRAATSDYILCLDSDDHFAPTFLEKALPAMESSPDIGIVTCIVQFFGVSDHVWNPAGGDVTNFLNGNECPSSMLLRKRAWSETGGYDETMKKGYEDWNFYIGLTKRGWRIHTLQEPLLYYRTQATSMVMESDKIRPELIRRLVLNHKDIFQQYIDYVILKKEEYIQWLKYSAGEKDKRIALLEDFLSSVFSQQDLKAEATKRKFADFNKSNKNKTICLYGAGTYAKECLRLFDLSQLNIIGFVDRDPSKRGTFLGTYPIYGLDQLKELDPDILALSMWDKKSIVPFVRQIKDSGRLRFEINLDLL
jgi:hypothetical protein